MNNPTHDAVDALLQQHAVQVIITGAGTTTRDENWECDAWRVTFRRAGKEFTTDFFTGIGLRSKPTPMLGATPYRVNTIAWHEWQAARKPVKPHPDSVLHSLILDASALDDNFGDWCSNFGYDSDSLKALNTYNQCCLNGRNMKTILGADLVAELTTLLEDY